MSLDASQSSPGTASRQQTAVAQPAQQSSDAAERPAMPPVTLNRPAGGAGQGANMPAPPEKASAEDLLAALAAGDHAAYVTIYNRVRPMLRRAVRRVMRSADGHAVDDVLQQILSHLWEHRVRLSQSAGFEVLLTRIARDTAVDALRHRLRWPVDDLHDAIPCPRPGPATLLQRQELAGQLEQAISELTPAQRQALKLKQAGLTAKEIGEAVGCSPKAAERRDQVARETLRQLLLDKQGKCPGR